MFSPILLPILLACGGTAPAYARAPDSLAAALRHAYFAFDFEGGVLRGEGAIKNGTPTLEAQAWYLLNLARYGYAEEAVAEAKELVETNADEAWAWFALAGTRQALSDGSETALEASRGALVFAPDRPDVQYLHAEILRAQEAPESALVFTDSLMAHGAETADLLVSRARSLYDASRDYTQSADPGLIDSSFATYARARLLDPSNVAAHHEPGELFQRKRRSEDAYPLLERAAMLAPLSGEVQQEYLHAVQARDDLSDEEKRDAVSARVGEMLAARGEVPDLLYRAAHLYGDVGMPQEQRDVEDRLLEVEPESGRAEWVHLIRIRRFAEEHRDSLGTDGDLELKAAYRTMLRDFVGRGWYVWPSLLGEAYLSLFHLADSLTPTHELVEIVEGMVEYEELNPQITYRQGALALAERGRFREAERVARAGFEPLRAGVEQNRDRYTDEEYDQRLRDVDAMMHDALGWIYFQEGRLDDAERELARSYDLVQEQGVELLYHLGRLYEARYDEARPPERSGDAGVLSADVGRESLYATAFQYYRVGASRQTRWENPNEAALEELFVKRNGNLEGFEDFLAASDEENALERRRGVLDARLPEPRALEPFTMELLDGGTISSAELMGKVVVMNAWYTSCGPCVWEMPDLQELHDRYRDDPNVLILTINRDQVPDDARTWLAEKGLSLPTLIDDGYLDRMQVWSYPTTWFLDRSGRIAFVKTGWSKHLVEEFSWRIEALR